MIGTKERRRTVLCDLDVEAASPESIGDASHLHRTFVRRYGYAPAHYQEMARSLNQP
jgi:hypothetical protein